MFQEDLKRQLEAKKARQASLRDEDVNWAREQDKIYKQMMAEERARDREFKEKFRSE